MPDGRRPLETTLRRGRHCQCHRTARRHMAPFAMLSHALLQRRIPTRCFRIRFGQCAVRTANRRMKRILLHDALLHYEQLHNIGDPSDVRRRRRRTPMMTHLRFACHLNRSARLHVLRAIVLVVPHIQTECLQSAVAFDWAGRTFGVKRDGARNAGRFDGIWLNGQATAEMSEQWQAAGTGLRIVAATAVVVVAVGRRQCRVDLAGRTDGEVVRVRQIGGLVDGQRGAGDELEFRASGWN